MIAYEREHSFVMFTQHDHALASGAMAAHWNENCFTGKERRQEVLYGVSQHDRSWIAADDTPLWYDAAKGPYTFMNFPLLPKLLFYEKGVDEIEQESAYAALLCSLHYTSFFDGASETAALEYVRKEQERQHRIRLQLSLDEAGTAALRFHFDLLQFCDNLSLYVCMQEPGVAKEEEISWFRNGFPQSFAFAKGKKIIARWTDGQTVSLTPFPFNKTWETAIPYKNVSKEKIRQHGVARAYEETEWSKRYVRFTGE
ncbi:DUF3891 family protein [Aneurinibacillus sp. BA2021]|nr:DUF3891 family protein [Aneurinibacillus sp. BA2021]